MPWGLGLGDSASPFCASLLGDGGDRSLVLMTGWLALGDILFSLSCAARSWTACCPSLICLLTTSLSSSTDLVLPLLSTKPASTLSAGVCFFGLAPPPSNMDIKEFVGAIDSDTTFSLCSELAL